MNKKLRFLVIPALALVFGLAFAGCGNDAVKAAGGDDPLEVIFQHRITIGKIPVGYYYDEKIMCSQEKLSPKNSKNSEIFLDKMELLLV